MALFGIDQDVATAYTELRDLTIEAVQDASLRVSPRAVLNIAGAGAALDDGCDFGAAVFLLAAVPQLDEEHGISAKNQELASEALALGKLVDNESVLLTFKELALLLFTKHHQFENLKQQHVLYKQQIGTVVTAGLLRAIMPKLSWAQIQSFLGPLNAALVEFDIITPKRWMSFLAESALESNQLRSTREEPSSYASSASVYKGRGAMRLTGKWNYRAAGKVLGLDLVHNPDWVASDALVGFRAAGWFWKSNGLNERADAVTTLDDFGKISNIINRGTPDPRDKHDHEKKLLALGWKERRTFYEKAQIAWADYKNRCELALIAGRPMQL
jgi:predicted chitinase